MLKVIFIGCLMSLFLFVALLMYACLIAGKRADEEMYGMAFKNRQNEDEKGR